MLHPDYDVLLRMARSTVIGLPSYIPESFGERSIKQPTADDVSRLLGYLIQTQAALIRLKNAMEAK